MQKRVVIVLVCLLLAGVAVIRADRQENVPLRESFAEFPMLFGDWRGKEMPPMAPEVEKVLGADDYMTRVYYADGRPGVGIFVGYWQSQRQGDTIHSPLNCLPGAGWQPISAGMISMPDPRPGATAPMVVQRVVIQKGLDKQLVLYWYQSHGRIVGGEYWGKFYLMYDAMRLNRTDGSIVRVTTPIASTAEGEALAEDNARNFITEMLPRLTAFLPE
ncbi:MAG TPA: EpsI family protein [Vicinamibacterales bacterium]|nr:EpsI family protein [Vicinamibacterales bacterium]